MPRLSDMLNRRKNRASDLLEEAEPEATSVRKAPWVSRGTAAAEEPAGEISALRSGQMPTQTPEPAADKSAFGSFFGSRRKRGRISLT